MKARVLSTLLFLSLAACTSDPEPLGDAGMQLDATVPADSGLLPVTSFEAHDPSGPRLVLGNAQLTDQQLVVEVVGHELSNIYGLSFRVTWDPAVLNLQSAEKLPGFSASGLEKFQPSGSGLLLVALGQVGTSSTVVALDNTAIARMTFTRTTSADTELWLRRGFVMDHDAIKLNASLGSGEIVTR